jgi:single-strand DNA-binding protein
MAVNLVVINGRLGADADVSETNNGTEVVKFRIANTRRYKDRDGERQEQTAWVPITAYGKVGSGIIDYLVKGKEVTVVGRLRTYQYEDKDGETRYGWEVNAQEINLGSDPRGGGSGDDEDDEDEAPRRSSKARKTASASSKRPAKAPARSRRSRDEDVDDDDDDVDEKPW